jgi:hypothetical protein
MPEWLISIISVIVGAAIGIGGTELVQWYNRPKLKIDFEDRQGQKPYIPDYHDETLQMAGYESKVKYLRLKVCNKGRKPVMGCEAKFEIVKITANDIESDITSTKVALHWSRNDPLLYPQDSNDKVYSPINLNMNDEETVDVLKLSYSFSTAPNTNHALHPNPFIESCSLRQLRLQANWIYQGKVTVYASNATPKSFDLITKWDGTTDGFNKAFTKN